MTPHRSMITSKNALTLGALAALLAGSLALPEEARADDKPKGATTTAAPATASPATPAPAPAPAAQSGARPAAPTSSAVVEDQYGEVMTVEEPSFNKPASGFSLGGSGKGNKLKELHVWVGAHEILVPLEKITRIDVGKPCDGDLMEATISLAAGAKLRGKVDRDLELHGRVQFGLYQIRFERLKSIVIRA